MSQNKLHLQLASLGLGAFCAFYSVLPSQAAEKIYFTYGSLLFSLRVSSLKTFATEGKVNQDLKFYLKLVDPKQQSKFQKALTQKADISPILLSRFFNSSVGEKILDRFGRTLQIPGGVNGKYGIRGALVQAALDPQGLTLLNFLQKFPTEIQVDLNRGLAVAKDVEQFVTATESIESEMRKISTQQIATQPVRDFSRYPDLRQMGNMGVVTEKWQLEDTSRNRKFFALVYKPQRWREGKTPVIIFSHGLASKPEDFGQIGEYMASYGYVFVIPQHPGSDYIQIQDMIAGYKRQVFEVQEFIDRPKDISYIIDELTRRNQAEFGGRLKLDSVGVAGHSFGGYTALALGGAKIDWDNLEGECDRYIWRINLSLLLQCQALELPQTNYTFKDPRVGAIFAINPANSAIFGQKGLSQISLPVMLGSGSYDPATPIVYEQSRSFLWLTTPDKYLAILEGQAHVDVSKLDPGIQDIINSVPGLTLADSQLLSEYTNALFLGFFEVYIAKNDNYRPYLESSYAKFISQEPFELLTIDGTSSEQLSDVVKQIED
ncbi:alpha/beta hydrolase [Merismopedia glauca]|uniref:Dienelactone hydrolase n=1 Tax=Merismopedia glauca CCAP 1448/3 TaxID=1296344 RepID=A0A2T1C807_9CYAN|nr:alpha/beta hydrolase [Merismopedia glauca]PSB04267.1 dienelactone hydrolase [Merismopedia glauca CCAP 1448/3]